MVPCDTVGTGFVVTPVGPGGVLVVFSCMFVVVVVVSSDTVVVSEGGSAELVVSGFTEDSSVVDAGASDVLTTSSFPDVVLAGWNDVVDSTFTVVSTEIVVPIYVDEIHNHKTTTFIGKSYTSSSYRDHLKIYTEVN